MSGPVRTHAHQSPLTSTEQLVEYFRAGGKPPHAWRIGVEQEKVAVLADGRPVPFDGAGGIEELLRRLKMRGNDEAIFEGNRLLGLAGRNGTVTVEPGGQVEHSGPALPTAVACGAELVRHVREVTAVAEELGIRFLGVGLNSFAALEELPWLPKARYRIMRDYLPTKGRLAHHMMKATATVQANLDYDDEPTAVDKMRMAFGVTSIVTALYAASPLSEGRPNGYQSFRAAVWLEMDDDRCGLLPFAFDEGFGFRDYAEWALDVPMFFVVRAGVYHPIGGMTFRRFMRAGWNGERATMDDWAMHLSTLFPEVRLKRHLEVRGADAGPMPMALALPALWRGLLDDRQACQFAWELVRKASMAEREDLRRTVPKAGLQARFLNKPLHELAVQLCQISADGLRRLPDGTADAALLAPLHERAATARSPADDMLSDYQATNGDPTKLVNLWRLESASPSNGA